MTIKEVAEIAGVSASAVSRYFNGGPLSEDKRKKILKAVKQTGFSPSVSAKIMRTGKSGQIGVIVPHIHSDSFSHIMSGIADRLKETEYIIILGCTDGDREREIEYINAMERNNVEGIILMGTVMTPALKSAIEGCPVPLVVTGQNFPGIPCIYHDDFNAMRELTERMLKKGRRNIAYIGVTEEDEAAGRDRRRGVEAAVNSFEGGKIQFERVVAEFSSESGRLMMEKLLKGGKRPDGVICASDFIALGAMSAIKEAGLGIPEDVSIAGIGDSWADVITRPQLTSVHLYFKQCGTVAVETLINMIDNKGTSIPVRQTMLGYDIMERESL